MILERRVLVFPRADFLDAMRRYSERLGKPMPDSPPENFNFDPSQDVALAITFPPAGRQAVPTRVTFSRDEVGTALTNHAREHRVPLPKSANKLVEKYKDGAALTMQLGDSGLHVMVIDDQAMVRSIIKKSLSKLNPSHFVECSDGAEALQMLRNGEAEPDIILCDLHMKTMGGDEFLRQLRADKANRSSRKPVLILTADKSPETHEVSRQLGASKVLTKPIPPDELIKQVMLVRGYFEVNK